MDKILVINVNWLGDVIFSSPVFKSLKEAYPQARISCLAVPRVREVLESIPFIDEIIVYDEKGRHRNPLAKLKLILDLRRRHFDIAFLLHRSLTRALLVYLAGISRRVGYDEKGRGRFLTHKVRPLAGQAHRSDYYLNIIESYGVPVQDRRCQLAVSPDVQKDVDGILKSKGIQKEDYVAVVNPGGNWDLKRWAGENFSLLVGRLTDDFNAKVVLSGAAGDVALAESISLPLKKKPVILAGTTNLKQLTALMKRANLVVSADSGPLHLANGVGTATVGVFGPTRPEVTGPRGPGRAYVIQHDVGCNRKACYFLQCPDNVCMQSIIVEDVLEGVRQIQNQ